MKVFVSALYVDKEKAVSLSTEHPVSFSMGDDVRWNGTVREYGGGG